MHEKYYINRIKHNDKQALDMFIRELYPDVYRFVYHKMNGADISKDITQEVFLRFIKNVMGYEHNGKVLNYLFCIASHLCVDYFRKNKKAEYIEIEEGISKDEKINVHEEVIAKLKKEELLKYIYLLHPKEQDVILLKYFHQLTLIEIAKMYNTPESTIKSRHAKALLKLKQLLKEGEFDE